MVGILLARVSITDSDEEHDSYLNQWPRGLGYTSKQSRAVVTRHYELTENSHAMVQLASRRTLALRLSIFGLVIMCQ